MSTRTFKIYGAVDSNTNIDIWINDQLTFCGNVAINQHDPFGEFGTEIISFEQSVKVHGYSKVKLTVNRGSVILGRTRVIYPARIENPITSSRHVGSVYLLQPIADPKYLVRINNQMQTRDSDKDLVGEWHYRLEEKSVLEYYHLHFNGPNCWQLPYSDELFSTFKALGYTRCDYVGSMKSLFLYKPQSYDNAELDNLKLYAYKDLISNLGEDYDTK